MVVVLLSPVFIRLESFACVLGENLFNKVFVLDRTDGVAYIQWEMILVYDVMHWRVMHHLIHGESHMK